ncbi:MAG: M28 family peptidase, partial [Chitinophagaceae bacterium]
MKKTVFLSFATGLILLAPGSGQAQKAAGTITVKEVERIENVLASDSFMGRAAGTRGSEMAAAFIAAEFKKAGLQPVQGSSYLQEFVVVKPVLKEMKFKADGADADVKSVIVFTSSAEVEVDEKSGYEVASIKAGESFGAKAMGFIQAKKNTIVVVDTSFSRSFPALNRLKRQQFRTEYNTVFLLGTALPKEFKIKADHSFEETKLANVVGILPGKSKKAEQVIFSAHYDHLGIGKPVAGDSIYNGANDDAAGTTAVIMLAKHFKKLGNNERTLVFAAFTA